MQSQEQLSMGKQPTKAKSRGTLVGVWADDDLLELLDRWRALQKDLPSRPEALRRLAKEALTWSRGKRRP